MMQERELEDVMTFLERRSMADVLICIGDMESEEGGICKTEVARLFPNERTVFIRIEDLIEEGLVTEERASDSMNRPNRLNLRLTAKGRKLADMVLRFRKEWESDFDIADAVERMRKCADSDEYEEAHMDADDILVEVLRSLGYGDLCDEYDRVGKWYA